MPARMTFASGWSRVEDDGGEVAARVGDGDATETVVAPNSNDDDGRVQAEDFYEAVDAVFGGVALTPALTICSGSRGVEVGLSRQGRPGRGRRP